MRTFKHPYFVTAHAVFQFLIGRLGTQAIPTNRQIELLFQFLIGRLGTQ